MRTKQVLGIVKMDCDERKIPALDVKIHVSSAQDINKGIETSIKQAPVY
jgi:hypothetical protein